MIVEDLDERADRGASSQGGSHCIDCGRRVDGLIPSAVPLRVDGTVERAVHMRRGRLSLRPERILA
jgi:hypothetical protein